MIRLLLALLLSQGLFGAVLPARAEDAQTFRITEIRTAEGIDGKFMPVRPSKNYAAGTSKIFCWFKWKNAPPGSSVVARWTYLTGNTDIVDYTVPVPRREGSGGVALAMPAGKVFPSGEYEVRLLNDKKVLLGSERFKVNSGS